MLLFFFFKQKTAYEMRISDWSSDVCSSDLVDAAEDQLSTTRSEMQATIDSLEQRLAEQQASPLQQPSESQETQSEVIAELEGTVKALEAQLQEQDQQ